ncbi:bcl-2-like protein 11 isoform X3 [Tachysurus fulvidraco]|uniref:bcl-2-like protein 11 isoform X3 n=1 Tax=Tachysurus fulvidraco TaxID=1234273 RepID=UPI000F4F4A4E|nr:bcl-2-like protein 11 isoform X3 [Tachysurus fulvidraco]
MPRTRASVSRFVPLIYSATSPWARAPLLMFTAVWNISQRGLNCTLRRPRQNRADGPAFLKEQGERGESGSRAEPCESPQPSELDVFYRAAFAVPNIRLAYQSRSPVFRTLSRSSSGYFSFDSEPSSPLITHSTATQTPSPSSQVITHALQRISEARGDAHNHDGNQEQDKDNRKKNYGLLSITTIYPTEQHLRGTCKRSERLRESCGASAMNLTSFIFVRQKETAAWPLNRPRTSRPSWCGWGS